MMNKFIKIAISTITALSLIAGVAYAAHKDGEYKNCKTEHKVEQLTEQLGLNESQQQLLREFTDARKAMRENRKDKREAKMAELKTLSEKEVLEVSDITNMMEQKQEQRRAAMQPILEKFVAFRNSLTEEQRAESQGMIKHLLMGGHRGHRGKKHHDS